MHAPQIQMTCHFVIIKLVCAVPSPHRFNLIAHLPLKYSRVLHLKDYRDSEWPFDVLKFTSHKFFNYLVHLLSEC